MHLRALRRAAGKARALSLQPDRHFWPIVGLIILVGLLLRLPVHDFGLPWFEELGRVAHLVPRTHRP